jgi:hypothetical protein
LPELQAIWEDYHSDGVEVVGVNVAEPVSAVRPFARQYDYLFLLDLDESTWKVYMHHGSVPLNYVIDDDENQTVIGWMESFEDSVLRGWIDEAIATTEVAEDGEVLTYERLNMRISPNPFDDRTFVQYELPGHGKVSTIIYNLLGQKTRTLVDRMQNAGSHTVVWDGRDDSGRKVPSGQYFLRLAIRSEAHTGLGIGQYTAARKVWVVR